MGTKKHRQNAPRHLKVAILTVSSTHTLENDESGHWISKTAAKEGHRVVAHSVAPDDAEAIKNSVCRAINDHSPDIMIITGGTGIAKKDVTIEAVRPMFKKELTAFGMVVSQLSFEQIDSAAILSRSAGGIIGKTAVFCIPGSKNACKLICASIIFPEAGHIVKHILE